MKNDIIVVPINTLWGTYVAVRSTKCSNDRL